MNRRSFLIATAAFAALPATAARASEDYVANLVDLLKEQGFDEITVTRTLLGRVRIVGVNSNGTRELICNPRTGEILRDVLIAADGTGQTVAASGPSKASSGSSGKSGDGGSSGDDGSDDDHGNAESKGDDTEDHGNAKSKSDDNEDHGDGESGGGNDDNSEHGNSGSNGGGGGGSSGHGSGHDD